MKYYCNNCKKYWNYPVDRCIFCGGSIEQSEDSMCQVIGYTKVHTPSSCNQTVPYYVYLLEDEKGLRFIQKSPKKYEIGEIFALSGENTFKKRKVGIVGTGLMGSQISEFLILQGYNIVVKTRNKSSREEFLSKIKKKISKQLKEAEIQIYLNNLQISFEYSDLSDCDIIIDASIEDITVKKEVFQALGEICDDNTILATNTSSIPIKDISSVTDRAENCIGMHFFNPVKKMDLVEIVVGENTSEKTKDKVIEFTRELGKKPIVVKDSPGFVVNRLLLPQINEAIHLFERGIATKEDIDSAIKLGLNHPMGPFELADFIGLDVCLSILEILHNDFENESSKPAKLLYKMVKDGNLGYKSGKGFYNYGD
jgi:3-hydroxybutyryl-CoA dehydrogenase